MEPGKDLLVSLEIAAPCRASWDTMSGDDRVRFCDQCAKNVYNLSGMTRHEAETLVRASEGHLCVRFYRRRDGTMLTDNCPVGLRAARRWARIHLAGISALLSGLLAFLGRPMAGYTMMGMAPRSPETIKTYEQKLEAPAPTDASTAGTETLHYQTAPHARGGRWITGRVGARKPIPKIGKDQGFTVQIIGTIPVSLKGMDPQPGPRLPNADSPPAPNGLHLAPDPEFQEKRVR